MGISLGLGVLLEAQALVEPVDEEEFAANSALLGYPPNVVAGAQQPREGPGNEPDGGRPFGRDLADKFGLLEELPARYQNSTGG